MLLLHYEYIPLEDWFKMLAFTFWLMSMEITSPVSPLLG